MAKIRVTDGPLRVRSRPSLDGHELGRVPVGTVMESAGKAGDWNEVSLYPSPGDGSVSVKGFVFSKFTAPVVPPVTTSPYIHIGVNNVTGNDEIVKRALTMGCRFIMVLNNPGLACWAADNYPGAVVMSRIWWNRNTPSISSFMDRQGGANNPRVFYTGVNEADEIGQGGSGTNINIKEIEDRAKFDIGVAAAVRAAGGKYAAGSFSMGTPEFLSQDVCDAMRRYYAPGFNRGDYHWNYHSYSPNMSFGKPENKDYVAPIWYERRWEFLFTKCGFKTGGNVYVLSDETGVDEGGVGGFPAHGASDSDVVRWCKYYQDVQSAPLPDGSISPFIGGALFQVGNTWDWGGYNVAGYLDALSREVWNK